MNSRPKLDLLIHMHTDVGHTDTILWQHHWPMTHGEYDDALLQIHKQNDHLNWVTITGITPLIDEEQI